MIKELALTLIIVSSICIDDATALSAEEKFDPGLFAAHSEFSLEASGPNFPVSPVKQTLITTSAFVVLTDEFFSGRTNALEILFFPELLTEEGQVDILHNDGKALRKTDHAILVLFIDKDNKIWQVNLTYVIPGTTVVRTVAWKPEELQQFFSDYLYGGKRLKLKSKGHYKEADSEKNPVNLTWDINLDTPVFNKIGSKENKEL